MTLRDTPCEHGYSGDERINCACPPCLVKRELDLASALEQACRDLQQAHNEILRAQGCPESEWQGRDWPKWTPQANTIRWAEKLLGKELGKRGAQP